MLEPDKTPKKGRVKKSKKRKEGESKSIDGDIESSIMNKKGKGLRTQMTNLLLL